MSIVIGFALGLLLVVVGAELLVRGASRAAGAMGIPPLVVGLTIVAYGTSAPELAVSVSASVAGSADIAVANVVGSNVFNALAILGACALIAPVVARERVVRREIPIMLAVTLVFLLLAADGALSRPEGVLLLSGLVVITVMTLRRDSSAGAGEASGSTAGGLRRRLVDGGSMLMGLALLVLGARALVGAASSTATALGVDELVIGLTVVAAGTSLPELATSVVALLRGQRDLAIGNVVGSNVFNLAGILGISAAAAPGGLVVAGQVVALDMWVMLAAAVVLLPLAWSGAALVRWEGAVLLAGYVAYTAVVVAVATGALAAPRAIVTILVAGGVAITVMVISLRASSRSAA